MKSVPYVVCAFHTDDPIYNEEIKRLKESLLDHELPHSIRTVPPFDRWTTATRYKPTFIREMLEQIRPLDLLYLDADAAVLQHPSLFDRFPGTLGVYLRPKMKELQSAIVYIKNNAAGREYARLWEASLAKFPNDNDQPVLQYVVDTYCPELGGVQGLPAEYCYKFPEGPKQAVIGQYQASRKVQRAGRPR